MAQVPLFNVPHNRGSKFYSGLKGLKDGERSGLPFNVVNDQMRASVNANPRARVRELAAGLDVAFVTVSCLLKEM